MPLTLLQRLSQVSSSELETLRAVLRLHRQYESVPAKVLRSRLGLGEGELYKRAGKLMELGLLARGPVLQGEYSYELTRRGLDVIALWDLVREGVIADLGERIGVGKESEVYVAWTPSETPVVIKLHKEGMRQFKEVTRKRSSYQGGNWVDLSIRVASREFAALVMVSRVGGLVPKPVTQHLHAVVMEYIDGAPLSQRRDLGISDALKVLDDVVLTASLAYREAGIVHGDLSPYNVLVEAANAKGYVIDWPQYVRSSDQLAERLLRADVEHIVAFYNTVFGLDLRVEDLLAKIKG